MVEKFQRSTGVRTLVAALLLLLALGLQACGSGVASITEIRDLQAQGRFEESIDLLKAILKESPQHGEGNFLLGLAYFRTARPSLAVWPLYKAEEDPEMAATAGVFGAMAMIQSRNNEDAINTSTRVLAIDPDNLEALGLRAQARLAAGIELEEALADINRVFEIDPDNGTALQPKAGLLIKLERLEEAGEIIAQIEELALAGDETGKGSNHWCLTNAIFAHESDELALAEQRFEGCMEKYPEDTLAQTEAIRFYSETRRFERAEELLVAGLEAKPAYVPFAVDLASRLRSRGEFDDATDVLLACVEAQISGREFDALWPLVEHYEAILDFDSAVPVMRRALRLNPDERLPFKLVDVLIRAERFGEALKAVENLDKEVYVELAKGRILLEQGRPKEALDHLNAGIRLWPNNPGARYYAALAAEQLGDFDRAILEYRDSVRSGAQGTDAGLKLAKLLYAQGDISGALGALEHHTEQTGGFKGAHGRNIESLELGIKLASGLGLRQLLERFVGELQAIPGEEANAVSLASTAASAGGGRNAALAFIRQSGLDLMDPANLEALTALVRHLLFMGAAETALAEVDRAIGSSSSGAAFEELRAQILRFQKADLGEVRAACEAAIKFDPNRARNLACMAWVKGEEGQLNAAVALYEQAVDSDPAEVRYPLESARLMLAAGEADAAERLLRTAMQDHPYEPGPPALLARYWVEQGVELPGALNFANRAVRFKGGPEALDTKGWAQLERGNSKAAVATLSLALKASSGSPSVRYRLARALAAEGRTDDARQALSEALKSEDFPEREKASADLQRLAS